MHHEQRAAETRAGYMKHILQHVLYAVLAGVVLNAPAVGAEPRAEIVAGSTQRSGQLTGGYDPEGFAPMNNTTAWGVDGVDLGANTEHDGKLIFFFGDVPRTRQPQRGRSDYPPHDADLVAFASAADPIAGGIHLTPVLQPNGLFAPFQIRLPDEKAPVPLLTNQTPTGAFSYGGRVYVFVVRELPDHTWVSYLTSSADPTRSAVYDVDFELSRGATARLLQVAPCVVRNEEIAGLPAREGEGLVMIGHAGQGVHLAWMPLQSGRPPDRAEIRYWTGKPNASERWSLPGRADEAARLFSTKHYWTSLSIGRVRETGDWILLYQKACGPKDGDDPEGPIVARIAATPWELAQADELVIFDPQREGAWGRYMHRPGRDDPSRWPPIFPGEPQGFAYGAFLLNGHTIWNADEQTATIWYLMSTFSPYQVQLMRSQIRIERM